MIKRIADANAAWQARAIEQCRNDPSVAAAGLCYVCMCKSDPYCLCTDPDGKKTEALKRKTEGLP